MANINDVKKLTKDFIFDIHFRYFVDYDDYYDDELYDKLTRTKMIKEFIDYYNNDISNIYNILNEDELSYLNKFILDENNINDLGEYHDIYDTLLITSNSKLKYEILDEIRESIFKALDEYNNNKEQIEEQKEVAYLIVGLVRSYGALYIEELKKLVNLYFKVDIYDYLNHPYVLRYVNTKSNIIRLLNFKYEEDYIDILKSHAKTFKTIYPYDTLITIGKYYFDINNERFELLKRNKSAFKIVMQDKDEFIIYSGLDIIDSFINRAYYRYMCDEEAIMKIISFSNALPKFELTDNSKDVMDRDFTIDYYNVIPKLYRYIAKKLSIKMTINEDNSTNANEAYEVLSKLDKNKGLIDKYILENKSLLSKDELKIVRAFKNGFMSDFLIYKHLNNGSIFIDSKDNKVYLVKGLITHIDSMVSNIPAIVSTYIFSYANYVICSGIISEYPVAIGPNLKKEATRLYTLNKDNLIKFF